MNPEEITILVVEKDAQVRTAIKGQLDQAGIGHVIGAASGDEAWRIVQSNKLQLVLSALDLPGMNGLTLLETLRNHPQYAHMPFILMSAGLDRRSAETAISHGISDLLIKPFTGQRLLDRIARVLLRKNTPQARSAARKSAAAAATERASLLVVDDTPDNLQLLAGLFRDEFKVKVATDGEKAIAICQSNNPPDLVLLDVMMPGMDGFQVAERLRGHPTSEHIPIVFVTAMTDNPARERGLTLGAVDYVFKPIDPVLLNLRVRNLMRYVEHRNQLQAGYDQMQELAQLRVDINQFLRQDLHPPLSAALTALAGLSSDRGLAPGQLSLVLQAEHATEQARELLNSSLQRFAGD